MLRRLRIENLAVFEDLEVEFGPGLNVISGESGAGKTMLVRALELVLGGNADPSLIGPFSEEAYIEASFDDPVPDALSDLIGSDQELTLAKRLRKSGPSRSLAGGRSCAAAHLTEAAAELLSLTGQHAARRLVSPTFQLGLLDRSNGIKTTGISAAYAAWQEAEKQVKEVRDSLLNGQRRVEMLRHEVGLYDSLEPQEDEIEQLEAEQRRLGAADALRDALYEAQALLLEDDGAADLIDRASGLLSHVSDADAEVATMSVHLQQAVEMVRGLGRQSRDLGTVMQGDRSRLAEVEERLTALNDFRRRFRGASLADIAEQIEKSRAELEQIEGGDELLEDLEAKRQKAEDTYRAAAKKLTAERHKAAGQLSQEVEQHLSALGLSDAQLLVEMQEGKPTATGDDRVTFMLRANKGLAPALLNSGASGGELSRVNLALLLASHNPGRSYLFDEVDSGIGGQTAHIVADKLALLAEESQLLVITHLAQIAVRADRNFLISKSTTSDSTSATLTQLAKKAQEREIARLIGASEDEGRAAVELLQSASGQG